MYLHSHFHSEPDIGTRFHNELVWIFQNGTAYRCFCTEKRLDLLRKDALRRRETPKYDNRCRFLTTDQIEDKLRLNQPHVIRFKVGRRLAAHVHTNKTNLIL